MSTNLYGIILWQMETCFVNEKQEIHTIHRPWLSRGDQWYPSCKLLGMFLRIIFQSICLIFTWDSIDVGRSSISPNFSDTKVSLHPIENLWHKMKDYLHGTVKPTNKQELIEGITMFLATVNEHKCSKYMRHLRKVIPKVIEQGGGPTRN